MRKLGIMLLCLGALCVVVGIVSLFFLPRTTLQGVSKTTLVAKTWQEMGYEVTVGEEKGGRVDFNINAPKNTDWVALERQAERRLQEKLRPRDTRGMFAGLVGGFVLVLLGGVVYRVAPRPRRKGPQGRREQLKTLQKVTPAVQGSGSPVLAEVVLNGEQKNLRVSDEEWEKAIAEIEEGIGLLSRYKNGDEESQDPNSFSQQLEDLKKEAEGGRRRINKARYLKWKIDEELDKYTQEKVRTGSV